MLKEPSNVQMFQLVHTARSVAMATKVVQTRHCVQKDRFAHRNQHSHRHVRKERTLRTTGRRHVSRAWLDDLRQTKSPFSVSCAPQGNSARRQNKILAIRVCQEHTRGLKVYHRAAMSQQDRIPSTTRTTLVRRGARARHCVQKDRFAHRSQRNRRRLR